jgi:UDP-N-acetylglucosamine--N-acetylmuramyl-(pentapeptide) pyrophosphoryl-undecaprenol N-acetylglucosamine transferase
VRVVFAGGGTGGHLYPGLAVARALARLDGSAQPFFIGARRGIERHVLPATEFPHLLLDLHPLYRARPWQNWMTVAGLVSAWRSVARAFREQRPAVVVGLGGYASGAALGYAAAHGVPIGLMEQDSHAGMATRFFSRFATEIYLGYGEASRRLSPRKGAWVGALGNPITPPPEPRPRRAEARALWGFPPEGGRLLLVFGGSQGARAINEAVDAWVTLGLPDDLFVIWGTGRAAYEQFAHRESPRVRVRPYLSPIADAYAAADLALTRAGALTIAELCAWGIPSILVPLPTAAADHQTRNARALESVGAAVHLPQAELTAERLDALVRRLVASDTELAGLGQSALARAKPRAAEEIARRILALAARQ